MLCKTKITSGEIAAILLVAPAFIVANSFGPVGRDTGASGDQTRACSDCHAGTENTGPGRIEFSGLGIYLPGARQSWRIDMLDPVARVYGFQVSARPANDPQFGLAGGLETAQPERHRHLRKRNPARRQRLVFANDPRRVPGA